MGGLPRAASSFVPWVLVLAACAAAFYVRAKPAYLRVLGEPGVVHFRGNDAWAHLRAVEVLVHNYPRRMVFDPFSGWPNGQPSGVALLFDFSVATAALALGGGAPSAELVRQTLAWAPAVYGSLIPLAVFALTRRLFGSAGAGVAAAWVVALIPGHFQSVAQLGFGDHHSLEGLLATTGVLTLTAAMQSAGRSRNAWLAAAALTWSAYLATWVAGALMIGILVFWGGVELLRAHILRKPALWVLTLLLPVLAFCWLSVQLAGEHAWSLVTQIALPAGALALTGLYGLFRLSDRWRLPAWAAPVGAVALAATALAFFALAAPQKFAFVADKVGLMAPDARFRTITELKPMLSLDDGVWFWTPLYRQFRLAFPLACVGCVAVWLGWRELSSAPLRLTLIWSGLILLLALSQVRSSYYLAINLAILSGFALDTIARRLSPGRSAWVLAALIVAVSVPSLRAIDEINGPDHPTQADYRKAFHFLRTETPEPLGDPAAYFRRYARPPAGRPFDYPPGAYGVMNWWDNGHTLTAVARRIPVSNPYQAGVDTAGAFYLEREPAAALEQLRRLKIRYVLAGPDLLMNRLDLMTAGDAKVDAMHPWVGTDRDDYYVVARREADGKPVMIFFPAYFETMAVRLSLYAGQAAEALRPTAALLDKAGGEWRLLGMQTFGSEEARREFLFSERGAGWRIATVEPQQTCVSLEAVEGLALIYKSQFRSLLSAKVFEVSPRP